MSERDLTTSTRQVFGAPVEKGTTCRICGRNVEDGRACYCSDYCRTIKSEVMSLLNWGGVRQRVLERDGHTCIECGFKQEWLDRGYDHLRELVEERLPEKPPAPSALKLGDGDYDDEELEQLLVSRKAWRRRRDQLIRQYFRKPKYIGAHFPAPESHLEVDHITPVSEGGHPFDPANLQTLCRDCHKRKTALEASERAERREMPRPEIKLVEFGIGGDD